MRPLLRLIKPPTTTSPSFILKLSLTVRPSSHPSRQGITAVTSSAVHLNVSAPAIDGRANAAATEVIAKSLGVAKTDVQVVKGERGREKVVEVRMRGIGTEVKGREGGDGILERVKGMLEDAIIKKDKE